MDSKDEIVPVSSDASQEVQAAKKKVKDLTPTEYRAYNARNAAKSRANKAAQEDKQNRRWNSDVVVTKKYAKELLEERLIRNERVIEVCIESAEIACNLLQIPMTAHVFTHGILKTLEARAIGKQVDPSQIDDVWHPGERVREHELFAMWDFMTSWRTQPDGTKLPFSTWKEYRRRCITDLIWFGNTVLGKSFEPEPHGQWADELFVRLNPDLLPEMFTQADITAAMNGQSPIHRRCLIACRNSFKSTISTCHILQWVLCFGGSIRILICSATQKLARDFAKSFRTTMTVRNPNDPSLLNLLWPEHYIAPDEGVAASYTSPFRQLDALIEPTLISTSIISEGQAGSRADLLVLEDVAEISNSGTEEQRGKTSERVALLKELLEPHGFLQYVGTPTAPGDVYSELLELEAKSDEKEFLVKICPGWVVKEGVNKLPYDLTLTADEVDLLFPSRLSFKHLKSKLRESAKDNFKVFRQQSLCSWVPDESESWKLTFDPDVLSRAIVSESSLPPEGTIVLSVDQAFSTSRYADNSSLVCAKIYDNAEGEKSMCILDVEAEHLRQSELGLKIVTMIRRHNPAHVLIEQALNYQALQQEIHRMSVKYSVSLPPIFWMPTERRLNAKWHRLKSVETLLNAKRIFFASGHGYIDALFQELTKIDGGKSGPTKKDDRCDAISFICRYFLPFHRPNDANNLEAQEMIKLQEAQTLMRANYQRIFGCGTVQSAPEPHEPSSNPIYRSLNQFRGRS